MIPTFAGAHPLTTLDGWFIDSHDIERRVEVTAPSMVALPALVVGTERIATVQRRIALRAQASLPIRLWEPPARIPRLLQSLQWHRRRNNDPAIRWLRDLVVELARHV